MSGIILFEGIFGRSCTVGFVAFVGHGMRRGKIYLVLKEAKTFNNNT